jgi:uncharacterized protein (DUF2062 family)
VGITLSFLFRLNKALVIIAANISVPPILPLILFASHATGGIWLGKKAETLPFSFSISLDMMWRNMYQYFIGAVTLSIVVGIIFGVVTYGLLKMYKKKPASASNP